ncbi:unnamed protein product, partial [Mesorhabditis spiculigera]
MNLEVTELLIEGAFIYKQIALPLVVAIYSVTTYLVLTETPSGARSFVPYYMFLHVVKRHLYESLVETNVLQAFAIWLRETLAHIYTRGAIPPSREVLQKSSARRESVTSDLSSSYMAMLEMKHKRRVGR